MAVVVAALFLGKGVQDEYLPGSGQSIFSSNKADQGLGLQQFESRQFEKVYFRDNKKYFADCEVSTKTLREKLIKILEMWMFKRPGANFKGDPEGAG